MAVFQLTYLALLTSSHLTPAISALKMLSYSCGYRAVSFNGIIINKNAYPLGLTSNFIDNYNLTAIVVLVPLLISLVMQIINKFKYNS